MYTHYELFRSLNDAGCTTKGLGPGRWKAKTPNQFLIVTGDDILYVTDDEEALIKNEFIEKIRYENQKVIVTNKTGEVIEFEMCA